MTTIRRMAPEELESFRDYSIHHEAAAISADEGLSEAEALAIAQREFDELLPLGPDTPNSFPMAVEHNSETVGCLWFQKEEPEGVPQFFLCDFVIFPAHRRRGYAGWRIWAGKRVRQKSSCSSQTATRAQNGSMKNVGMKFTKGTILGGL